MPSSVLDLIRATPSTSGVKSVANSASRSSRTDNSAAQDFHDVLTGVKQRAANRQNNNAHDQSRPADDNAKPANMDNAEPVGHSDEPRRTEKSARPDKSVKARRSRQADSNADSDDSQTTTDAAQANGNQPVAAVDQQNQQEQQAPADQNEADNADINVPVKDAAAVDTSAVTTAQELAATVATAAVQAVAQADSSPADQATHTAQVLPAAQETQTAQAAAAQLTQLASEASTAARDLIANSQNIQATPETDEKLAIQPQRKNAGAQAQAIQDNLDDSPDQTPAEKNPGPIQIDPKLQQHGIPDDTLNKLMQLNLNQHAKPHWDTTQVQAPTPQLKQPEKPLAVQDQSQPQQQQVALPVDLPLLVAKTAEVATDSGDISQITSVLPQAAQKPADTTPIQAQKSQAPLPPEVKFAQANHAEIVQQIRTQLLPNGGTMRLRLDPPELGALQVTVQMRDGIMQASFQTSNDQATQLLTHSLNTLKTALESQGVAVDKLNVQQIQSAPESSRSDQQQQSYGGGQHQTDQQARQEEQRKQVMQRLWRRLALGRMPLDLVG